MPSIIQGGGVTSHGGVTAYVDLIVHSFDNIENEYPQSVDLFRSFAKYRQGSSNFGYAEIAYDKRLSEQLSKTEDGLEFYDKLLAAAPLITVSDCILGDSNNLKNVAFFNLSDFEKDPLVMLDRIAYAAKLNTKIESKAFIDKIEKLNKIFSLKLGLFGFSININALIDEWIAKRKSTLN